MFSSLRFDYGLIYGFCKGLRFLVKNRKADRKLAKFLGDYGFDLRFYGLRFTVYGYGYGYGHHCRP